MEDRDRSILTQVAFKSASHQAATMGLNLTDPQHQAVFEEVFSFLTESLFNGIQAAAENQAAAAVIRNFPGTQVAQQAYATPAVVNQGYQPAQPNWPQGQVVVPRVKGQSNGPFPDWALQAFAEQGVQEVYDNRHMLATNPKRPWFKSTSGGDNAPAFWPPDR